MKRFVVGALALVAGLTLLVGTPAGQAAPPRAGTPVAAAAYVPPALHWSACSNPELASYGLQCAWLTVPMNYADPAGPKVHLALSRKLHTSSAANYKGVMLANPGGPGAPGRWLAQLGTYVPNDEGTEFDWIGFDPRGVGASNPSIHCDSGYFNGARPWYVPVTAKLAWTWRKRAYNYAGRCAISAAHGLLPYMKTVANARDMDMIRVALGKEKISYYGFSWGTYLGAVYATMFPDRVDRFVLDGVVDPTRVWYKSNFDQDRAFNANMNVYWHWLAQHPRAFRLGTDWTTIRAAYYREVQKLRRHPAAGGRLGPDELGDAMLDAGYYVFDWNDLGHAFSNLVRFNRGSALYGFYASNNVGDDNGYAGYAAVLCTDAHWPGWARTRSDSWAVYRTAPFETWGNTWYNAPCLSWPAASGTPHAVSGSAVTSKILLINETRDAATPFSGALRVRALFPTASLISGVNGTTHAGSLSGVGCVDNAVAAYLKTGIPPARTTGPWADKRCPRVSPPPASLSGARVAPHGMPASFREKLQAAQARSEH